VYFCTLCPSIGPKERSRQALDRLPLVSNLLTNFYMQHFDGSRLSQNFVRNAVWLALNEPVCQYLRTTNPRCSTVYIDNILGPLARDSLYILATFENGMPAETRALSTAVNCCYRLVINRSIRILQIKYQKSNLTIT